MTTDNNQIKRWILPKPINKDEINNCIINYTLQKVLCRRGFDLDKQLSDYLTPLELPNPIDHFSELNKATNRIIEACKNNEKIAICGDYDADGITSTVLLVEILSRQGANAISFIPSRIEDGYGLNLTMIDEINKQKIKLIITVDNGISAFDAIKMSRKLGIDLIITDHHKIPDNKLEIYSLIHPERTPSNSPYKCLAGVGIAYMLAKEICKGLDYDINKSSANALFCIGTIADMAPLVGANRKWLKECLPKINSTSNLGFRMVVKKLALDESEISPSDIAFKIAPLINAVGRISNPHLIINLLTNKSEHSLKKLSKECFAIHKERKRITALIEKEALKIADIEYANNKKFLVLINDEWHPGIIGIVAARVVENYNLPTAILSRAKDRIFRGSIRSNNLLKVNLALKECSDLLIAHGGHSSAAGFSIDEDNIPNLKVKLNNIAIREFENCNLNKYIKPDAYLSLLDITFDFYKQLMLLGPFGIMNKEPLFWTRKCRIMKITKLKGNHTKFILNDGTAYIDAIKWNFTSDLEQNDLIDIAYNIEINKWNKQNNLQLNIIDIKKYNNVINIQLHNRNYKCQLIEKKKIKITNSKGISITSDFLKLSDKENYKKDLFVKKILSFAEIALGQAT